MLNATAETGYLPDLDTLDDALLDRTTIFYICSPSNPHGAYASAEYLTRLLKLARKHNFLLLSDECYSDVWRGEPPVGALEVAAALGDGLSHLIVLNSLSKRSNAAGLRAGFLAGDANVIALYKKLVANGAALLPTPLLRAAGALYRDEDHATTIRQHYEHPLPSQNNICQRLATALILAAGFSCGWLLMMMLPLQSALTKNKV